MFSSICLTCRAGANKRNTPDATRQNEVMYAIFYVFVFTSQVIRHYSHPCRILAVAPALPAGLFITSIKRQIRHDSKFLRSTSILKRTASDFVSPELPNSQFAATCSRLSILPLPVKTFRNTRPLVLFLPICGYAANSSSTYSSAGEKRT